jgi:hypothetical protein
MTYNSWIILSLGKILMKWLNIYLQTRPLGQIGLTVHSLKNAGPLSSKTYISYIVAPHVIETIIKSLKLQLSLKVRANQVVKV